MGVHVIFCFVLLETFLVSSILCSNGVSIKIYNKGGFGFKISSIMADKKNAWAPLTLNFEILYIDCTQEVKLFFNIRKLGKYISV